MWISSGEAGFRFLFSFPLKFTLALGKIISLCPLCLIHSGIGNDIQSEVIGEAGFRFLFSFPLKFTPASGKIISQCLLCLIILVLVTISNPPDWTISAPLEQTISALCADDILAARG
ncbi:MAG: hypothetical protein IKK73_07160, partial [Akkermansia sp.]|nr:hypothetical protein [Akkermansia sp.]